MAADVAKLLQPGDIILVKTPSQVYLQMFRMLGFKGYDHTVLVVDDSRTLHIGWPRAKLVPTILFTTPSKQGLLIRPRWTSDEQRN